MIASQSKAQTKSFVETMRLEGYWKENEMTPQSTIKDLNLIKKAFIVRMITMPLQVVPFVGGVFYSAINATFTGWDYMDRYFDAIHLSSRLQRVEVFGEDRSDCLALCHPSTYDADNDYARFGFMCGFMESIPIVGWVVFPITNAVAAALFACDIEKMGGPAALRGENPTSPCIGYGASDNATDAGGGNEGEIATATTQGEVQPPSKTEKIASILNSANAEKVSSILSYMKKK